MIHQFVFIIFFHKIGHWLQAQWHDLCPKPKNFQHIDGLVQDCGICSANALEIQQYCIKSSPCPLSCSRWQVSINTPLIFVQSRFISIDLYCMRASIAMLIGFLLAGRANLILACLIGWMPNWAHRRQDSYNITDDNSAYFSQLWTVSFSFIIFSECWCGVSYSCYIPIVFDKVLVPNCEILCQINGLWSITLHMYVNERMNEWMNVNEWWRWRRRRWRLW